MVRVSGPDALKVVDRVFTAVSGKRAEDTPGYRGLFGRVHDGQGEIDEAVVFVYRAPKSYTGEDVAEICCHGGIYLVQRTLRACLNAGARAAQAGEFTRRAFLNGKMNLTQAEAVADLIAAQGQQSAQAALQARDGAIFRRIHQVVEKLLGVSSALAAWVDYPDEDIDEVSDENLCASVYEICGMLEGILKGYDNGRLLRDTDDPVERMGVELARKRLNSSYLVLAVFDSSEELSAEDLELIEKIKDRPVVAIINKSDLPRRIDIEKIREKIGHLVQISASEGEGVQALEQEICRLLKLDQLDSSAGVIANERQRSCVEEAWKTMEQAKQALDSGETLDAVNVCIDSAIDSLLELTGERASNAVIDQVFERFCVGK